MLTPSGTSDLPTMSSPSMLQCCMLPVHLRTTRKGSVLAAEDSGNARQRQCLSRGGQWKRKATAVSYPRRTVKTQGKGCVLAAKGSRKHKAKALSHPLKSTPLNSVRISDDPTAGGIGGAESVVSTSSGCVSICSWAKRTSWGTSFECSCNAQKSD